MEDLSIEDIYKAMKWAEQYPQEFVMEDEYRKIFITPTGISKIELKPKGFKAIQDFLNDSYIKPKTQNTKITEIFGIKVLVSEDVKDPEFRW